MKAKSKVWVLTREINQYDQDGEYFVCVFAEKPSTQKLAEVMQKQDHGATDVMEAVAFLEHLRAGGGRRKYEDTWFHLKEVELL